jgi:alkanesulfonate monooxygenase SsuD/methylene tetrahydromethanopterin reductase-like flavin-dependent oxidoreductase (luciferase family)
VDAGPQGMRFGLYLDLRSTGEEPWPQLYERALALCERADETEASSVWLSEHHGFGDGHLSQPLTFAAAIAARTRRLRVGTAVLLATLRHPRHLAEEAVVVDILSNGRLDLGLGAGSREAEFRMFGISAPSAPLRALFDARDALLATFAGGTVTPPPVQPSIPIWLGCDGPRGAHRAGKAGARLLSARGSLWDSYRIGLLEGGHDPGTTARMSGPVNVFLSDEPDRDREVVARAYERLWNTYAVEREQADGAPPANSADAQAALAVGLNGGTRGLVVATPDEAARLLVEHFRGVPIDTLFTWGMLLGMPQELMDRHVELWSGVLPRLVREHMAAQGTVPGGNGAWR